MVVDEDKYSVAEHSGEGVLLDLPVPNRRVVDAIRTQVVESAAEHHGDAHKAHNNGENLQVLRIFNVAEAENNAQCSKHSDPEIVRVRDVLQDLVFVAPYEE